MSDEFTLPPFSETFLLLQQEGFLLHSCLTQGFTATGKAQVGNKGSYHAAFFNLSIGLERLMKAVVIIDHMARNDLAVPTTATLKAYGHNLQTLFASIREISERVGSDPLCAVQTGSIEEEILEHLSDFGNGARYFNLDRLTSPGIKVDPLARWGTILRRILDEDVPNRKKRGRTAEAAFLADSFDGHAKAILHDLDSKPLGLRSGVEAAFLSSAAAPYAVYRVILLIRPLAAVLEDASNRAMALDHAKGSDTPSVPFMHEFVQFAMLDKPSVLRKIVGILHEFFRQIAPSKVSRHRVRAELLTSFAAGDGRCDHEPPRPKRGTLTDGQPPERVMDSNFHFGPARSGEMTAYGARAPDASLTSIFEWGDFMRAQGITRVCCLLDAWQLAGFPVNLEAEYKKRFGATGVLMEPIADHHLCSRQALQGSILPFLKTADTGRERAVIHCWGGNGRTGHVLAAWLVAARGLSPMEAIESVEATGRLPREAVLAGNATLDELIELLASCEPDVAA